MAEVKLTKNELRAQQQKLFQLEKYLPTLKLKKALLQAEILDARVEIQKTREELERLKGFVESYSELLTEKTSIDVEQVAKVKEVYKRYENVAGVEVPFFEKLEFKHFEYHLFSTPPWVDAAIEGLREVVIAKEKVYIAIEKRQALEKELRQVTIRVNLFEKVLIPRALANIKKIKVFLGDQELASVSQAKVAKMKIEQQKQQEVQA